MLFLFDNSSSQCCNIQHDDVPPPVSPYSSNNDQSFQIPLFHVGDEPAILTYNGSVTAQYSEVKREHMTPCVPPHTSTTAEGDYSILTYLNNETIN